MSKITLYKNDKRITFLVDNDCRYTVVGGDGSVRDDIADTYNKLRDIGWDEEE